MTKKKQSTSPNRIPPFTSIEEEAKFWDTHSTADYEGEFRRARVRFGKQLSRDITIHLDSRTMQKVRAAAHERGIGPTSLIRVWVLEQLSKQQSSPSRLNRELAETKK